MPETQMKQDANGCWYSVEVPDEEIVEEKSKKVIEPPKPKTGK